MKVYHIPCSVWVAAESKSDAIKIVMSQMDWVIDPQIEELFNTGDCEGIVKFKREGGLTRDVFEEVQFQETWVNKEK